MKTLTRQTFELVWNRDLYELLERKSKYSEYIDWWYEEHFKDLVSEVLELQKEVKINWDIQWEIMDVVYVVAQLLNKLNRDWLLEWVDFWKHRRKIMWRSPNLKQWKKIPREIEQENWYKLKSKQK